MGTPNPLTILVLIVEQVPSVFVVCWIFLQTFQTYFCILANSVDPDQTAPKGCLLKSQADGKADDTCSEWQFKG